MIREIDPYLHMLSITQEFSQEGVSEHCTKSKCRQFTLMDGPLYSHEAHQGHFTQESIGRGHSAVKFGVQLASGSDSTISHGPGSYSQGIVSDIV